MKLTDRSVAALKLPPGKDDYIWFDDPIPGYGARLRKGLRKTTATWVFQYSIGRGQTRRITIGKISALPERKARELAADHHAKVHLGGNPSAEKRAARVKAGETFGALLPRYIAHKLAQLKPRSFEEVERHLTMHARSLHARSIDTIDQRAAALFLAKIADANGPSAANRVRASASAYFSWLLREGLAAVNPFANTNKQPEAASRDRTLVDSELREIWEAVGEGQYANIIRLLMLTGSRRDEIANLKWDEVDLDNALVVLPPARTKAKRTHEISLSAPALAILESVPRRDSPDGFVFGRGARGFSDWSGSKRELDARILAARQAAAGKKAAPMAHWTPHDFRRSMSTTMHERLGVAPHIVEACLGHTGTFRSGVSSVYNRSSYRLEKARAWTLWGAHVTAVVEGRASNVTSLRGRS
jgi:integrase